MPSITLHVDACRVHSAPRRRLQLQRLFSAFPGGWPGVGLLLLRAAVALAALVQGGIYLTGQADAPAGAWIAGFLGVAAGGALLIGILTPLVALVVGLGAIGIGFSLLPPSSPNLFDAKLPTLFAFIMTLAIVFLGPGAFSVDARLFGRREIIIPPSSRSSR